MNIKRAWAALWREPEVVEKVVEVEKVTSKKIMFIEGKAYALASLTPVELPPKPKVAKGRAK
jgi:hypothetical protein